MSDDFADYTGAFGDFGSRAWLDTAHQGALPLVAAEALREAVAWKTSPRGMTFDRFRAVPDRLRGAVGALLEVPPDEVVLSNSASYGIHLLAQAFPWRNGDEILVVEGDFPSNILPWLSLEARSGVRVRQIAPRNHVVEPDELADALTERTRLLCTSWVHSFSGHTTDLRAIGSLCRERDVVFLVNASQGLGAAPLDASTLPIDCLVSIGSKWLCGPYGTGIFWMRPELRCRLVEVKAYWLVMQALAALGEESAEVALKPGLGAPAFDIFGTANFFNFLPFAAALELLLDLGVETVCGHDQALVSRLIDNLPDRYRLLSPRSGPGRSTLVFVSHRDTERNADLVAAMDRAGVDVSLRRGAVRISPHLHNTAADVDRVLDVLDSFPG